MTSEILVRYLHFISILSIAASLTLEHLLLKKEMKRSAINRMATVDGIYGLSAIVAVAAGLSLWMWVGKPADFYTHNWIFHLKLGLLIIMAICSIPPTIFYLKNRRKSGQLDEIIVVPTYVFILLRIQLILLVLIPLCAVFMAKGIGYIA